MLFKDPIETAGFVITAVRRDFVKIQVEPAPQMTFPFDPPPVDMGIETLIRLFPLQEICQAKKIGLMMLAIIVSTTISRAESAPVKSEHQF